MTWWYLSFVDDTGFLGACVVEVVLEGASDAGMIAAVRAALKHGCNPGGAARGGVLLPDTPLPPPEWRHRLMSKAEIERVIGPTMRWKDQDDPATKE